MRTYRGAAAGGCDLSPHRRRLLRPAGLPRRLMLGASRGCCLPIAPAAQCWPTPSAPGWLTTNRSIRTSRDDPLLPGEQPILSNIPTAVSESGGPAPAPSNFELMVVKEVHGAGATACWLARVRLKRSGGLPPAPAGQSGQLYRPDTLALSTSAPPSLMKRLPPRHIDLRPYVPSAGDAAGARRPDPRGPHRRVAGGQLVAGRRNQGYRVMRMTHHAKSYGE